MKGGVVEVEGEGAYEVLRWESGVHRVQRVPRTEGAGRVHTSTVQVVVGVLFSLSLLSSSLLRVVQLRMCVVLRSYHYKKTAHKRRVRKTYSI